MRSGIIAMKVGMTRVFAEDGRHVPVTVLKVDDCRVVAKKTVEKRTATLTEYMESKSDGIPTEHRKTIEIVLYCPSPFKKNGSTSDVNKFGAQICQSPPVLRHYMNLEAHARACPRLRFAFKPPPSFCRLGPVNSQIPFRFRSILKYVAGPAQ